MLDCKADYLVEDDPGAEDYSLPGPCSPVHGSLVRLHDDSEVGQEWAQRPALVYLALVMRERLLLQCWIQCKCRFPLSSLCSSCHCYMMLASSTDLEQMSDTSLRYHPGTAECRKAMTL